MSRGFTLLEVLVYMAILTLMLQGLFISAAYLHDAIEQSAQAAAEILHSMNEADAADVGTHDA